MSANGADVGSTTREAITRRLVGAVLSPVRGRLSLVVEREVRRDIRAGLERMIRASERYAALSARWHAAEQQVQAHLQECGRCTRAAGSPTTCPAYETLAQISDDLAQQWARQSALLRGERTR